MPLKRVVFHWRVHSSRNRNFKLSHLFYASKKHARYQAIVKLLGSFRLSAPNRHLHRYCIFTELFPETVLQSLRHSCASELHTFASFTTRCQYTNDMRMIQINANTFISKRIGLYLYPSTKSGLGYLRVVSTASFDFGQDKSQTYQRFPRYYHVFFQKDLGFTDTASYQDWLLNQGASSDTYPTRYFAFRYLFTKDYIFIRYSRSITYSLWGF